MSDTPNTDNGGAGPAEPVKTESAPTVQVSPESSTDCSETLPAADCAFSTCSSNMMS